MDITHQDPAATPDAPRGTSADDLSAIAWVHDELRRSLDTAHKALRRHLKETDALAGADLDAVDPAVLRSARSHIHQGVGALELVGLPAAAMVLRASEAVVQRASNRAHPLTAALIDDIEHASFALLDYLSRLLAGKDVSPLAMFPQYRAVADAAGSDRVHPADLWAVDWSWRELPSDPHTTPRQPDAASRTALEGPMLVLMRGAQPQAAAARMSEVCAGLGADAKELTAATLWKLASAVFEAQAQGLLGFDVFSKRMASRLLAQFRMLERGEAEVSERLAQDLLFFAAQSASPGDGRKAPRLAAVRQVYGLAHHTPTDYSASVLGRFDPALIAQARKRVVAAKETWSAVAGAEMHRLAGLSEQFALVGDSLKRLFPHGEQLAAELQQAVALTQAAGKAPPAPLAMEVATSLLYVEAALEDADFDSPDQAARVQRLAERLAAVCKGSPPDPLEAWMEELYRRVSDRQTMGSVVQELRASLSEAEKLIDQYFRNPLDRRVLIPVPNTLSAMRGVLSVLGMDHAAQALLRMRDEVDGMAATEIEPEHVAQAGVFDRLAGNLGALGFLIDMLSVQPQMAKSLFRYDADTGNLSPVMGRGASPVLASARASAPPAPVEQRLIEQAQMLAFTSVREDVPVEDVSRDLERLSHEAQAADQPALAATVHKAQAAIEEAQGEHEVAAARGELSEALVDFVSTASDPVGLEPEIAAAPGPATRVSAPITLDFGAADLEHDAEMREVFLEEAQEVLQEAEAARVGLESSPDSLDFLTTLRRAFHTLKGSSRMVGLKEFGEAAWAGEQVFNTHLADQRPAEEALLAFTGWTLKYLSEWTQDIAAGSQGTHGAMAVKAAAQRLATTEPDDAAADIALPFTAPTIDADELRVAEAAELPVAEAAELLFDFDLSAPHAPADAGGMAPELMEAFDLAPTEPLPLANAPAHEAFADHGSASSFDDLDLDLSEAVSAPMLIDMAASPASDMAPTPVTLSEPEPPLDLPHAEHEPAPEFEMLVPEPEPAFESVPAAAVEAESEPSDNELIKVVGPLRIGIPLFNIYLNEADELSRRLSTEVAEWAMELHRPIGETPIALAHSLAGSSATVGFHDLSQLARALEHAQMRSQAIGHGTDDEARLFVDATEEIRRLLHQFAAGFLKEPSPDLLDRLAEHELSSALRLEAATAAAELPPVSEVAELDAVPEPLLRLEPFADEVAANEPEPVATVAQAEPSPEAEFEPEPEPGSELEPEPEPEPEVAALPLADLPPAPPEPLFETLGVAELKPFGALPIEPPRQPSRLGLVDGEDDLDAVDAVDEELFPIFQEEAAELLPQLAGKLRDWARRPAELANASACMRTLHTLKGGARLAGAMRLGEMAHRLETRIERLLAQESVSADEVEMLQTHADALSHTFDALVAGDAQAAAPAEVAAPVQPAPPVAELPPAEVVPVTETLATEAPEISVAAAPQDLVATDDGADEDAEAEAPAAPATRGIDWSRFATGPVAAKKAPDRAQTASQSAVRVRAPLLDRLVNQAGEVSIARSRIESGVAQIKGSLADLTENLERLRGQLRDIELQAETQMSSRLEAAKAASQNFDPLEFDRFTRFQEITRMMAESVNDVATVQRSLQRSLEATEDELVAQARMTRDLQDDLLRTRMVEFEGLSDRLYRVVRQAAKETGKSVRLDIVGGSIEVDRGVLDRMTGAFEHLLRNCVTHGIEAPDVRTAAGKDGTGAIIVALSQEGNEVGVEFRDDGAGLDLQRIRNKAVAQGLLPADASPSDAELTNLIFAPGFSTADTVTELAGRGVGMDVVRSEVNAMGGRIETATSAGQGTSFKMILPLTTAVTQVVMLRCGETTVAVPSTLVEVVRRATPAETLQAYASGSYTLADRALQFFWLGALLQASPRAQESAERTRAIVVVRSAQQRIALHVDEVLGNQEVVVKHLGPQLSRLPGLAGITLLASGAVALIYNPVALATLYGDAARAATQAALLAAAGGDAVPQAAQPSLPAAPLVLVVDDSLTVRRVTQRLLLREGYRVTLAKDGLDALAKLAEEVPQIVLSDIEMPRMDGFDLVRNMRADARLRDLPVIMITSRIAQKHRDYAAELGVDHYLGKPYAEEDLLSLIARYTAAAAAATA